MLRTRFSQALLGLLAVGGLTAGVAGPAASAQPAGGTATAVTSSEPTGQYTYMCLGGDGYTYTLPKGTPLSSCKGTYLQKYIGGVQVETIQLSTSGALADPNALPLDCLVAVVGTGAAAYGIVKTRGVSGVAYVRFGVAVSGLSACLA